MKRSLRWVAPSAATFAFIVSATAAADVRQGRLAPPCKPTIVKGVTHLCGPATAQLSAFAGVVFRHGSCISTNKNGRQDFTLELGQLTYVNPAKNGGLAYFHLTVSGPLSRPTSGYVIVFWRSKRWSGIGVSLHGNANKGTFVVQGVNPTPGRVTGSYHC
jgi:hypothetical protein